MRTITRAASIALLALSLASTQTKAGTIVQVFYDGIPGTAVADLTSNALYPSFPTYAEARPQLSGLVDSGDNYGSMMEGYVVAPVTGDYKFFIRSDDASEFWISNNHLPGGLVRVARETGCCNPFLDDGVRASGPIPLVRGNVYFIRVLHKEGGGGDFVEVGWTLPGQTGVPTGPIPGLHLAPRVADGTAPAITLPPADLTVGEGETATFFANSDASQPATYQWKRNGVDIPDAILQYYTIANARLSDSGARFTVAIQNSSGTVTSDPAATLTVVQDTTAPTLVSALTRGNPNGFELTFSERVTQASAENLANYSISDGISITSATLQPDGRTVRFVTGDLIATFTPKVLTVNNVIDLADAQNRIAANSQITIIHADGIVKYNVYRDIGGGTAVADLTSNTKFPNFPDLVEYRTLMEGRLDWADNYGAQLVGYLTAPKTGDYIFAISADDGAHFYISTDESPANKQLVCQEPTWNASRDFTGTTRRPNGENISGAITLQEGRRYYVEALVKEGGGGDNLAVAWQIPDGPAIVNGAESIIPGSYLSPYQPTYTPGPVTITTQPFDQTVTAPNPVTFRVVANGTPAYVYQWYRDGNPIPNANAANYTITTTTAADDGAKFKVRVSNAFSEIMSAEVTLTVIIDTVAPQVVSAGSLDGTAVGVVFNEIVNASSANNAANYKVNGANVTSAQIRPDNRSVQLTLSAPIAGAFTVTVNNVQDLGLNPVAPNSTVQSTVADMLSSDLGTTTPAGTHYSGKLGDLDLTGGGADVWGTSDNCHFTYAPRTGNFDVKTRVARLDQQNNWSKGGLMARETLDANAREVITYPTPPAGANQVEAGARVTTGTDVVDIQTVGRPASGIPDRYIRMRRVGQAFTVFYGTDGISWAQHGAVTMPADLPPTLLVGVFVTSHNDGVASTAEFRDFGNTVYPGAGVTVTQHPQSAILPQNASARLTVAGTVSGAPANELVYQWLRNGQEIFGANAATYVSPPLTLADSGVKYSCRLSVPGAAATSQEATITVVIDNDNPFLVSAHGNATFDKVLVKFDGLMNPTTTAVVGNYSIPGLTISGAAMDPNDGSTVILDTTAQTAGATYTVTVNNVTDLAGNMIAANSSATFQANIYLPGYAVMRRYDGLSGTSVDSNLRTAAVFPNSPSVTMLRTLIESPTDAADNYGVLINGFIIPTVSGNYNFWISADDNAQFWLSTDESPANMTMLCTEPQWNGSRDYQGTARRPGLENRSSTTVPGGVALTAGEYYYFEALMKEGGGGDNLSVAWQVPGGGEPANGSSPIGGNNIAIIIDPMLSAITWVTQPQDTTVLENTSATFTAAATGESQVGNVLTYQWQRNNGIDDVWTDIAGATGASYTIALASMADNGTKYRVNANVPGLTQSSAAATLTVTGETEKPRLLSVGSLAGDKIGLRFSELISQASAQNIANYVITSGGTPVTVTGAVLRPDGRSVELTVSGLTGNDFTAVVSGIQDRAATPNTIDPNTTMSGSVARELTSIDISGPLGGNPATLPATLPSEVFAYGEGTFEVKAGGYDIWNSQDGCNFVYEQRTGDFDVRVKVTRIDATSPWAKAGLMARESLAADARNLNLVVDPLPVATSQGGTGVWMVEGNMRATTGADTIEWPGSARSGQNDLPNQWIRLQREGNTFRGYRGTDGENWQMICKAVIDPATPLPDTLYVGMATTAHADWGVINTLQTVADYQNYGEFVPTAGKKQVLIAQGGNELNANDRAMMAKLASAGRQVTTGRDNIVNVDDAAGMDLAIVSASVSSGNMVLSGVHKFLNLNIPIISSENENYDDLYLTAATAGSDFGTIGNQTGLLILDDSHPMAGGLSGVVTVASDLRTMAWGSPNGFASIVAVSPANGRAVLFAYEAGASLVNNTPAPAKRIGAYFDNGLDVSTADGDTLFKAIVDYAVGGGVVTTPPIAATRLPDGTIRLTWDGPATLQRAPAVTGSFSDVPGATSGHIVTPSGTEEYYRLRN